MKERGISLIALIITIIVIIILAAISIAGVSGIVERSRYAKFCGDLDAVQDAVSQAYGNKQVSQALENPANRKTSEEIYKWVATGEDNTEPKIAKGPKGEDLYQLENKNNNLGLDLPKYGNLGWGVDPKTGEVYLVDGFEYNDHVYYSKTDVQNGGKEKDEDGGGEETDDDWAEFHQVITVDVPSGAIPVVYEEGNWKVADRNSHWYDYRSDTNAHQWANVVTVESGKSYAVDEIIPEDDILGMFVYIPRYAYKITRGYHSNVTGEIKIAFINQSNQDKDGTTYTYVTTYPGAENGAMKDYVVHPAFTNDPSIGGWNKNLNGFWVAKFEAGETKYEPGGDEVTKNELGKGKGIVAVQGETTSIRIEYAVSGGGGTHQISRVYFRPNMMSTNYVDITTIKNALTKIAEEHNISSSNMHLLKNSEWGAIAYLTQSEYGNTQIWNNPCEVTGMAGSSADAEYTSPEECSAYDTQKGQQSSSTGNVYGVYDLTGGMIEYVAAYIENDYGTDYKKSFSSATPYLQNEYGTGEEDEASANYEANNGKWGDAMWEISNSANGDAGCWNEDGSCFPGTAFPFFVRGGNYARGSFSGVFSFTHYTGNGFSNFGFRVALVP